MAFGRDFTRFDAAADGALVVDHQFPCQCRRGVRYRNARAGDGGQADADRLGLRQERAELPALDIARGNIGIAPDYGPFARITGYVKDRDAASSQPDCQTPQGKEMIVITRTDWRWNAARRA